MVIVLAADLAPPFLRMLGSRTWTFLDITEGEWSILMAARCLVFIIFILAAGVVGDLWGRRRMLLIALAGFMACIPVLILSEPRSMSFLYTYAVWSIIGVMIRTLTVTFVVLEFEGTQRILALVIYSIISGLGSLLTPLIASAINQSIGFLAIFPFKRPCCGSGFDHGFAHKASYTKNKPLPHTGQVSSGQHRNNFT